MAHIIFIPSPEIGHLVSTVEVAKLLIKRELRLSITILILSSPAESAAALSVAAAGSPDRIEFVALPHDDCLPDLTMSASSSFTGFIDHHKPRVRDFMAELTQTESSTQLAGVVVDMFTTTMMDVADDFRLPSYVFFTSSAASLCLFYHGLNHDLTEFSDFIDIPGFANSVPASSIPFVFTDVEWSQVFRTATTRFTRAKGIIVNTFFELEPVTLNFMSNKDKIPPIYPVGPILNLDGDRRQSEDIISWLDDQPSTSVLFLCFGSRGCFSVAQVAEIARALESSKVRFLWSLRNPSAKMNEVLVGKSIDDAKVILPDGFLERTAVVGKVIGWAPQAAVLAHTSVRGFVSHCGWNSVLESLWCGVPIGAWPLYAEQPINSFQLVKELGLATAITVDKKNHSSSEVEQYLVTAEEIENGIKQLTAGDCAVLTRENVRKMSEACRMSRETNGSSYVALGRVVEVIMSNISRKEHK